MRFVCKKYEKNPILTKEDVPYHCDAAYNAGALALTASLIGWYVWKLHREMEGTVNYDWFFSIAPLTALGIAIVVLAVSGLLRNYVVFRR